MKRILIGLILTFASVATFAQTADRDVLVTPDGTVYTVEQQVAAANAGIDASTVLSVTVQNGTAVRQMLVPESTTRGYHFGGTFAYDSDSKTLFVVWIHMNGMSSELLVAPYRDGRWQSAASVDNQAFHIRSNLRLGITRRVPQLQADGTYVDAPALILHALWWDESGSREEARYALLTIEKGTLSSIETHSLEEFVAPGSETFTEVTANFNKEILRHPAIVSSPSQSSVDVVFGDAKTNTFHGARLQPIADSRIHIPVGIGGGGSGRPGIRVPRDFTADWNGSVTVLSHGDKLVLANTSKDAVNYIMYSDGVWSDIKSVATGAKLSADAAIAAIDRMLSVQ